MAQKGSSAARRYGPLSRRYTAPEGFDLGEGPMVASDDWRRRGQEAYLKGVTLQRKRYTRHSDTWDHDHCEFCWAKFMEAENSEFLTEGYATQGSERWICHKCFEDFQSEFRWTVVDGAA